MKLYFLFFFYNADHISNVQMRDPGLYLTGIPVMPSSPAFVLIFSHESRQRNN